MINNLLRGILYVLAFLSIQIFILNHVSFLRVATPFLYLYILLKMPVGTSRVKILLLSFFTGLVMDCFSNTPGMHAAACTLAGMLREPLIYALLGKDVQEGVFPSYQSFGKKVFFRYTLLFVSVHLFTLFLLESLSFFDPLFLFVRIVSCILLTTLLVCVVEAFNIGVTNLGET